MKPRIVPPLTQADIDRPNGFHFDPELMPPRKPVLAVYGPSRTYWPLVFWFAWGCAIVLFGAWLYKQALSWWVS